MRYGLLIPGLFKVLLLITSGAHAQEYFVLGVNGSASVNGETLKPKDRIKATDKITFSSANDAVAVVSEKKGRFILRPQAKAKSSEFVALVKEALIPPIGKLSTRNAGINTPVDFQTYCQSSLLLLDTIMLKVSATSFPMNAESFFFIQYDYQNESVNKKLPFNGDSLIVARASLYTVDGNPISYNEARNLRLFFMQANRPKLITGIEFIIPDLAQLRTEIQILELSSKKAGNNTLEENLLYLNEFYGKVSEQDFRRWRKAED